jgi:hypothetical protein
VKTSPRRRNSWSFERFERFVERAGRLRDLGEFFRLQVVDVLVERVAG